MSNGEFETAEAAREFVGSPNETTLNRQTTLKIYFQRWPGLDANSGVEHGVNPKTVTYTYTVDGTEIFRDRPIGERGLVAIPLRMGGQTGQLEVFGTQYTVRGRISFEPLGGTPGCQRRMNALGYELGTVDGDIGRLTDRSTLNFQADHNPLVIDGDVGQRTRGTTGANGLKQNVDDQPK